MSQRRKRLRNTTGAHLVSAANSSLIFAQDGSKQYKSDHIVERIVKEHFKLEETKSKRPNSEIEAFSKPGQE